MRVGRREKSTSLSCRQPRRSSPVGRTSRPRAIVAWRAVERPARSMTRRDDDFPTEASARRFRDPPFFFFTRNNTSSRHKERRVASVTRPLAWTTLAPGIPALGAAPPPHAVPPPRSAACSPPCSPPPSSPRWRVSSPASASAFMRWYTGEVAPDDRHGQRDHQRREHHQHREHLPQDAHRRVIAVPHRRHRHPRPPQRRDDGIVRRLRARRAAAPAPPARAS